MQPETVPLSRPAAISHRCSRVLGALGIAAPTTPLNLSFVLALACAAAVWVFVWRTRTGYEIRTVGRQPDRRRLRRHLAGPRSSMLTMALSGALAGGVAVNEIMGVQNRLLLEFTAGYGFVGIAVALMGRGHPLGVVLASLLFGMLYQGGAELAFDEPKITRDMIVVIQGFVVLFAGALEGLLPPAPRPRLRGPSPARAPTTEATRLHRARRRRSPATGVPMLDDALTAAALILASSLRLAVPLIFACLAGLWSERAGVVDISLEGKMLAAAFASAVVAYRDRQRLARARWPGIGASVALRPGARLRRHRPARQPDRLGRGHQPASRPGLTALLGNAWYGEGGRTPQLDSAGVAVPAARLAGRRGGRRTCPVLGPLYATSCRATTILTYLALLAVPLTAFVLYRTRFGLRLRATGENPAAVDTAGISVRGIRYAGVVICGVLCGFAGTYLSVAQAAGFLPPMTAGKGFIALAALVFAKWRPWPALFTCLLFGFLDAASIRLQGAVVPGIGEVPVQAIQALPYLLTVVLLAGFVGRAIPPKASGIPYVKER